MTRTKIDYGIDLGTTNSAIVRMQNGEPKIIKSDTQKDTIPSCVNFRKKKSISVGDAAYNQFKQDKINALKTFDLNLTNCFIEFKRTMGTSKKYFSSHMNKEYTSEELSSEVLKKLKSFILDENFDSAVITVPAKFNTSQIDATQKAAELAGLSHVELLQEPIAASMAYGIEKTKEEGHWLVFDFGGGTFDAALIKVEEGIMKVVDTEGDNHLGGKDIDNAILDNIIIPYLKKTYSIDDIFKDESKKNILRESFKYYAEIIKIQLSFNENYELLTDLDEIPFKDSNGIDLELDLTVSREDFKKAVAPIFQQAIDTCNELIKRNNMKGQDLATILLVGGPTYSPILRSMIKDQISVNVNTTIDPMTAVAVGSALYASTRDIPSKFQKRDLTKIQLDLKYEATSVEIEEFVTINILRNKTNGEIPESLFVELVRSDGGWSSGKIEIKNDAELIEVSLESNKANNFNVITYDSKGTVFDCEPNEITIIQGSKIGSATLPMNIGIELKDSLTGNIRFKTVNGLEKNTSLPAVGKISGLKTQNQIRPGIKEDIIKIPLYEGENGADGTKAIHNQHIKDVIISGEDLPKLLPSGSDVELTINVDSSRRNKFDVYFPYLDETLEIDVEIGLMKIISAEKLEDEISKAINSLVILSQTVNANNHDKISTYENELKKLLSSLNKSRNDDDNRVKTLDSLRKILKNIDHLEQLSEWPNVDEELTNEISRLKKINLQYGNDKTAEIITKFQDQADKVKNEQNIQLAKQLIEEIRNFNHKLMDQGAGVAYEISIIKSIDSEFDMIEWYNVNEARSLMNQAKQIISSNPSKESLKEILRRLFELMPKPDKPIGRNDGEILID
ncbi:MAG: heat-shock protein Hsp70 [Candidatus Marinimicrobia bacterium]|nr:heat-shock protein Hsp70 [Candidatus Neomarinimicrobiota bacterium]